MANPVRRRQIQGICESRMNFTTFGMYVQLNEIAVTPLI
jgi:hypothetical protein